MSVFLSLVPFMGNSVLQSGLSPRGTFTAKFQDFKWPFQVSLMLFDCNATHHRLGFSLILMDLSYRKSSPQTALLLVGRGGGGGGAIFIKYIQRV